MARSPAHLVKGSRQWRQCRNVSVYLTVEVMRPQPCRYDSRLDRDNLPPCRWRPNLSIKHRLNWLKQMLPVPFRCSLRRCHCLRGFPGKLCAKNFSRTPFLDAHPPRTLPERSLDSLPERCYQIVTKSQTTKMGLRMLSL